MGERLTFASYVKCLESAMQRPYNQDFELTELLLEFLIFKGTEFEARGRNGREIIVDKTMVSNLLNNKENVHSSIRDNCDLDIAINGIKGYFEKEILPVISPHMRDDLMENMVKEIEADASISKTKRKEFMEKAEKDSISGFLASVFLYTVRRENKVEKHRMDNEEEGLWDTNEQYYNSFVENLFLHRGEGSKTVRLKDLFVMPNYEEIHWNGEKENGYNVLYYIRMFSTRFKKEERYQGVILFIEGDAGVGKTSLVSYLAYLYTEKKEEWRLLFHDKALLCVRLRDIIPEEMKFSRDTIVKDILKYLKLRSMDELKKRYKDPLIILDGFDELCMVEGINANSEDYIYQISKAFADYKVIITTRPQYLNVEKLNMNRKHIVLKHFDASQRKAWVDNYRKTGILDYEKTGIEYILDEENEEIDSICDTPMVMYMIVAGGINEEAKHNKWLLYHQIFYKELSDTEYNSMFPNSDGIYRHDIGKYRDQLYRLSAEIAYEMFCRGNRKLFLTSKEIEELVDKLKIEDIKLKEIVQHCYALCNYWKSNGKGAVEFYHNNIRDFFLCEKIFYEFNSMYGVCQSLSVQEMVTYMNERMYSLFRYTQLEDKVVDFLFWRTDYNYEHQNMIDFPSEEYKRNYLPHFFYDMFEYGGVSHYDRNSGEDVYHNMKNVLANTVRIYRPVLEPYLVDDEYIIWLKNVKFIDRNTVLGACLKDIFSAANFNDWDFGLASKGDFRGISFVDIDFRTVDFRYASFEGAIFINSDMEKVCLIHCNLERAKFISNGLYIINLSRANLRHGNLRHADLKGANLRDADLKNANLEGAKLEGADLEGANLRDAILPDGFSSSDQEIQINHLKEMNIPELRID